MASILVIDDEPSLREVIARALTAEGHHLVQAADGRRGLAQLRARPADLVLTDLVMPEQDGIETIMALRHLFPDLPVIAMSGDARHSRLYLEIATHLGVRRALAKPFTTETLVDAINETLERACVS